MSYFTGLDVSLEKTHICIVDHEGTVVHEATAGSSPEAIAATLNAGPACSRVVFETGRMALCSIDSPASRMPVSGSWQSQALSS